MESWHWLVWPALVIGAVVVVFGLDRLGLWLEDRGWLYYRRKKPTSSPMTALVARNQARCRGQAPSAKRKREGGRQGETCRSVGRDSEIESCQHRGRQALFGCG